jgi:hypothetical protein
VQPTTRQSTTICRTVPDALAAIHNTFKTLIDLLFFKIIEFKMDFNKEAAFKARHDVLRPS